MPKVGAGGTTSSVSREDLLRDGDCSEAEFYGVNIRDIAAIILQAVAEKFRETMADTRFPYRYRSLPGRDHAIVRRVGASIRDVNTFVRDFMILNVEIMCLHFMKP